MMSQMEINRREKERDALCKEVKADLDRYQIFVDKQKAKK